MGAWPKPLASSSLSAQPPPTQPLAPPQEPHQPAAPAVHRQFTGVLLSVLFIAVETYGCRCGAFYSCCDVWVHGLPFKSQTSSSPSQPAPPTTTSATTSRSTLGDCTHCARAHSRGAHRRRRLAIFPFLSTTCMLVHMHTIYCAPAHAAGEGSAPAAQAKPLSLADCGLLERPSRGAGFGSGVDVSEAADGVELLPEKGKTSFAGEGTARVHMTIVPARQCRCERCC